MLQDQPWYLELHLHLPRAYANAIPKHAPNSLTGEKESTAGAKVHSSDRNEQQSAVPLRCVQQYLDLPVESQRCGRGNIPGHHLRQFRRTELPGDVLPEELLPVARNSEQEK